MQNNTESVIIFGNGSMARVLYYMREEYDIHAFCVDKCCMKENTFLDKPLVSFEDIEKIYSPKQYSIINSIVPDNFILGLGLRIQRIMQQKQMVYIWVILQEILKKTLAVIITVQDMDILKIHGERTTITTI